MALVQNGVLVNRVIGTIGGMVSWFGLWRLVDVFAVAAVCLCGTK